MNSNISVSISKDNLCEHTSMIKEKMTCMTSNKVTANTGSFSKKKLTNSHAYTGTCIAAHDILLTFLLI